jgi:hypothetical protein
MKKYLAFAKEVSNGKFFPQPKAQDIRYSFSNVSNLLTNKACDLTMEVDVLPYTDIVLIDQNQNYKGVVLTDDVRYYQALTVKEIHAYTPMMLHQKQWPYTNIYSRQYWKNQERIMATINSLAV